MTQEHGQDQVQLVERVFELTQAMEHAVNLADWRHAARLGEERSPLLQSIQANQQPRSLELVLGFRQSGTRSCAMRRAPSPNWPRNIAGQWTVRAR